MNQTVTG